MTSQAMSSRIVRQCYPLYFTGIPGWIAETLRLAGLSLEEMTTAKWQSESRAADERRELLVLFDSRTAASRDNAAAFENRGCRLLDVAALLKSPRTDEPPDMPRRPAPRRVRVLDRAKQQIESMGFLWARIADYPYPFLSALVDDRSGESQATSASPRTILLPTAARERMRLDESARGNPSESVLGRADVDGLFAQYVSGQAVFVSPDANATDAAIFDSALESGQFPLLWRTNAAEFAHWRRLRKDFSFRIDERHRRYEIRYGELPVHFRPAVELWRGGHFAVVPLQRSRQQIDAGQVVYQTAGRRRPAGLAAWHADLEPHGQLMTAAAHAV